MFYSMTIQPLSMWVFLVVHTPLQLPEITCLSNWLYLGMTATLLYLGRGMSTNTFNFLGSGVIQSYLMMTPKKGILVHLKWHLSLSSFRLTFLHIFNSLSTVSSWSLPSSSNPASKISSAMPNTLGSPWNSWSIFHCTIHQMVISYTCSCQKGKRK